MIYENNREFALEMDKKDPLREYRKEFYFPQHSGKDVLYFTGNSLGLQPKKTQDYILKELEDWATWGVEGHFHARNPWLSYHEQFAAPLAKIVGAKPSEVIAMNQLTSNVHFLLVSFYKSTSKKYKIICEAGSFPSDRYALESQIKFHGFNPNDALIEISPRKGEHCINHQDIYEAIEKHKNQLALVFIGGVNYYTGQVFDMKTITEKAHAVGAYAGFDLAHAAGNIKLDLHAWQVDFAAWCSYKYLNSGPGSVAGAFVHQKHHNAQLPQFAGWWGHDKATRFKMENEFIPIQSAERWQVSNAPVLSMAAHKAAIELFDEVGMDALLNKSKQLTEYLYFVLKKVSKNNLEIITPEHRGCQLSIIAHGRGKELYNELLKNGAIVDWREPNVIRVAPVPLYNSYIDVYEFGKLLNEL